MPDLLPVLVMRRPVGLLTMVLHPEEDAVAKAAFLSEVTAFTDLDTEWCVVHVRHHGQARWPAHPPWDA